LEHNLVKKVIESGGSITPLIIPAEHTNGTGLMNPSIMVKDGKIIIIIRHVNYTFYHSEKKLFQHPYGPLTYIHPENDIHLRTWNWYCEIGDDFKIKKYHKIDTSMFDTYEPLWDFIGLEDARIFEWNKKLYLSGVRRDTTTNGVGRMELSEIKLYSSGLKEISRVRIEPPNDPNSYCEKNWMPIIDKPFHYIKWGNPTEVVKVDPIKGTSKTVSVSQPINLPRDLRGGSQVLPFKNGYFAITHEVDLFNSEEGRKDAIYYHRFIVWDKNFNIIHTTPEFHFMDADVEFSIGMAEYGDDYLITFGFQDNAAYLLKAPKQTIEDFIFGKSYTVKTNKQIHPADTLESFLDNFIQNPENPSINFGLAVYYHSIGQTASAVSYYLRAAERTNDELLRYEALLRAGMCFDSQGCRNNSVEGMLQHAVALMPHRPEGYFYLSRFYERAQKWFNAYTISSIGEKVANKKPSKLLTTLDYPGFYGIIFEKAVSSWWTGLCEESRNIFRYLSLYEPLDPIHKQAVVTNLKTLKGWRDDSQFESFLKTKDQELETSSRDLNLFYDKNYSDLKYKFRGAEVINRNYSEAFQDMFILTMLKGKTNGTYLEIGAGFPFYGNNTYLLESIFNWKGISLDITEESIERYFRDRNNIALCKDATHVNYDEMLEETNMPTVIDYLQLDCDPPYITYDILTKIPFDKYKFAVITYEHDYYADVSKSFKQRSRDFLISKGYELVLSNIAPREGFDYEDWYVHPDLVDRETIDKIKNIDDTVKLARNIFL